MIQKADAVVVGGGILGASVAYFLARLGYGEVALVEKSEVCAGATRHSAANVRQHYSNEVAIRLALRGVAIFSNSEEELGGPAGFTRCGYLVIAGADQEDSLRKNVELQQRLGVETGLLSREALAQRFPLLDLTGIVAGAYESTSGYADPVQTVHTIVASARRNGVQVYEHTPVLGIDVSGGRVAGVVTSGGTIGTPVVVNAAGPWANSIAEMVGGRYSLQLSREEEAIFGLPLDVESLPVVSDAPGHLYFRPAGPGRLLAGFGYPKDFQPCEPDDYGDQADLQSVERLAAMVSRRVPAAAPALAPEQLAGATLGRIAGVYSITDDWYPIVGASKWVEGFYEAVGGSGHSFKIGPPIGEALAQVIAGREPDIDISALSHSRFDEGKVFASVWGAGNRG